MSFKNVIWNGCVGNLEIVGEKIIFCDDKKSMNDFNCKIEIPINKYNKKKLKQDSLEMENNSIVSIENDNVKFEFAFGFIDDYKQFINDIQSIL